MNRITVTLGVLITLLIGCSLKETAQVDALSIGKVSVVGNIIYRNEKPFAELRFFDPPMTETLTATTAAHGLAIYYYDTDKEVWIWPKKGMSIKQDGREFTKIEEMNRVWGKFSEEHRAYVKGLGASPQRRPVIYIGGKWPDKEEMIRSVSLDIRISDDGRYVFYKSQGMIYNSSHKYVIDYSLSK